MRSLRWRISRKGSWSTVTNATAAPNRVRDQTKPLAHMANRACFRLQIIPIYICLHPLSHENSMQGTGFIIQPRGPRDQHTPAAQEGRLTAVEILLLLLGSPATPLPWWSTSPRLSSEQQDNKQRPETLNSCPFFFGGPKGRARPGFLGTRHPFHMNLGHRRS